VQVRARTTNGHTEVDVDENGKKVHITHEGGRNIKVVITPPANGAAKAQPTEVEAADAAELQKKNPEAARYYEQYATGRPVAFGAGRFGNQLPHFALPPRILMRRGMRPGFPAPPPAIDPPTKKQAGK
jgi:hypothetical protein